MTSSTYHVVHYSPNIFAEDAGACRGCLAMDQKLYPLKDRTGEIFCKFTGVPLNKGLQYLCAICMDLLKKFELFRKRCRMAMFLMQRLTDAGPVTKEDLLQIDRSNFIYVLNKTPVEITSFSTKDFKTLCRTNMQRIYLSGGRKPQMREYEKQFDKEPSKAIIENFNHISQHISQTLVKVVPQIPIRVSKGLISIGFDPEAPTTVESPMPILPHTPINVISQSAAQLKQVHTVEDTISDNALAPDIDDIKPDLNAGEIAIDGIKAENLLDDLIVKEENLILPVDDEDNVEIPHEPSIDIPTQDRQTVEQVTVNQTYQLKTLKPVVVLEKNKQMDLDCTKTLDNKSSSSSSSSSSSDSDSSSSSLSRSSSVISVAEIMGPVEIDLTADDDDKPKAITDDAEDILLSQYVKEENRINSEENINAPVKNYQKTICQDRTKSRIEIDKNDDTLKRNRNNSDCDLTKDNSKSTKDNSKSAEDNSKLTEDNSKLTEDNRKLTTAINCQFSVGSDGILEKESSSVEELAESQINSQDIPGKDPLRNTPEKCNNGSTSILALALQYSGISEDARTSSTQNQTIQRVYDSDSSSSNDLPDCLMGLNSDIYKKDVRRNFPESKKRKSPVRFVEEEIQSNKGTKRKTGDSRENIRNDVENIIHNNAKIMRRDKVKPKLSAKEVQRKVAVLRENYALLLNMYKEQNVSLQNLEAKMKNSRNENMFKRLARKRQAMQKLKIDVRNAKVEYLRHFKKRKDT